MAQNGFDPLPDTGLDTASLARVSFALHHYRHLIRLREYVEQHLDSCFQLADVASEIGLSPSRLSHIFIEKAGVSFSRWISHERIQVAARLLSVDDRSISEIALAVGYENLRSFQRSFKKNLGMTPSEYRQLVETQMVSQEQRKSSHM